MDKARNTIGGIINTEISKENFTSSNTWLVKVARGKEEDPRESRQQRKEGGRRERRGRRRG